MMKLLQEDLNYVVAQLPRDVRELLQQQSIFLGGGFIRETIARNKVNDIDLFGQSQPYLYSCLNHLKTLRGDTGHIHETDNAYTLFCENRLPVQCIMRWLYHKPELLLESFDFTICQAVIWYENNQWDSMISDHFYADLAAKRLVYTAPIREEEAGGSLVRVKKFLQRGYNIQLQSFAAVISRLVRDIDFEQADTEEKVTQVITGLLRDVDPLLAIDQVR